MTLLITFGVVALAASFVCSLLEASLLSIPPAQVEALAESGSRAGHRLKSMKENIDRPLAAILTVNTVAHTAGAAGVGAQAATVFGSGAVGIASAAMTLLILIFSEIIPKTLGAVHARALAGVTAALTGAMIVVCLPLILVLEWMSRLMRYERSAERLGRAEVLAAVRFGHREGVLDQREYRIVANLMALALVRLREVLTPRIVLFSLPQSMTAQEAVAAHPIMRFARIPVYGAAPDDLRGYVSRFDIQAVAQERPETVLESIVRPLPALPDSASAAQALDELLSGDHHIAMVVDEHGVLMGIVTLEDLLESLLGQEIVDETDPAADMRELARRHARRRRGPK